MRNGLQMTVSRQKKYIEIFWPQEELCEKRERERENVVHIFYCVFPLCLLVRKPHLFFPLRNFIVFTDSTKNWRLKYYTFMKTS